MRAIHGPMFKNRIVGHGHEPPDQLLANPRNFRIHPEIQQDALEVVMETVGWIQEVIKNNRTGHVVDGHLRIMLALRRDEETVPVTYIDVSEEEEKLILLTLDPLSALAGSDAEKLPELREEVIAAGLAPDLDLDAILKREKKRTRGLSHEVHECKCCKAKCHPDCGCYRETEQHQETSPPPRRRKKSKL